MNDIQIMTLALSVVVPVSFLLISNSRVTDVKEALRAEMQAAKAEILHRLDRIEDNITRLLADHDQRIAKLEGGQR